MSDTFLNSSQEYWDRENYIDFFLCRKECNSQFKVDFCFLSDDCLAWICLIAIVVFRRATRSFPHHCLETRMKLNKERRLLSQGQHPLLHHGTVDIIILNDDVLLQNLDGIKLVRALSLGQHDLWDKKSFHFWQFLSFILTFPKDPLPRTIR